MANLPSVCGHLSINIVLLCNRIITRILSNLLRYFVLNLSHLGTLLAHI